MSRDREVALKHSARGRFYQEDFSGLNLQNADFRNATLTECNFSGANLSYANLENANCWGSDFTDAVLYRTNFKDAVLARTVMMPKDCFGITITLTCDTLDRMAVNEKILNYWLYMATTMKPETEEAFDKIVLAMGGPETYEKFKRLFKERTV